MKIPESIEKLTTTVSPSFVDISTSKHLIPIDEIILLFKKNLDISTLSYFERGLVYMKNDLSCDKNIIKSFISLVIDTFVNAVKNSNHINEDVKCEITNNFKKNLESLKESFDAIYNILYTLNKQNYLLDKNYLSAIIIGYALSALKKIHNS
jgi:hypothetical protein